MRGPNGTITTSGTSVIPDQESYPLRLAKAYQRARNEAAQQSRAHDLPITEIDQLELMTKLVLLADEVVMAVLREQA